MNVEQALAEIKRLTKDMGDASDMAAVASNKYSAHMTLYNVAVMTADKVEIEKQRDILHNLLDQILDMGLTVGTHQRAINHITRNVTD